MDVYLEYEEDRSTGDGGCVDDGGGEKILNTANVH
jgi:hypothetical protein